MSFNNYNKTPKCYDSPTLRNQQFSNVLRSIENVQPPPPSPSFYQNQPIKFQNQQFSQDVENYQRPKICTLCWKNCETPEVFQSHTVKAEDGRVTCPILRRHICDICGATGDYAHTRRHCPNFVQNEEVIRPKPKYKVLSNGKTTKFINH
ncbi:nanos, partial [Tribolium castaneum]